MHLVKRFPTLYAVSSTKKVKEWTVSVFENSDGIAVVRKEYGYVGKKIVTNDRKIRKGKNIGKANETTPITQALSESESSVNVKRDANHEYEIPDLNTYVPRVILPQLASGVKKGKITFPCHIQPKLNGICCLSRKTFCYPEHRQYLPGYLAQNPIKAAHDSEPFLGIGYHSRGGQMFSTLAHLDSHLMGFMNNDEILHGELYVHGWSLQRIGSYVKDLKDDAHLLEYWVYDKAVIGVPWIRRWTYDIVSRMTNYILNNPDCPVKLCPTLIVNSYKEVIHYHNKWISEGFEGAILRNYEGIYIFEHRSKELEKVKEYKDAEFIIVGGKEGVGNDEGCVIFRCRTEDGQEFDVRPRGTVEDRRQMLRDLDKYIGQPLTVRFAELSESGIPLQPVGIIIRDYE